MVFPVVMYGCESWTVKKAERQRMDAFELWCWKRLLRVPWTAGRSNQSILSISKILACILHISLQSYLPLDYKLLKQMERKKEGYVYGELTIAQCLKPSRGLNKYCINKQMPSTAQSTSHT